MFARLKTSARRLAMVSRRHKAAFLVFIGSLLAGVGIVADSASPVWLMSLETLGVIVAALGGLLLYFQAKHLEEEDDQKSASIIDLQKRLSDSLVGGEDFARIVTGPPRVLLMGPKDNSLYDINIRYTDTALALEHSKQAAESLYNLVSNGTAFTAVGTAPYHRFFKIDFLHPKSEFVVLRDIDVGHITLPFVIDARFTARNGRWHQVMILDADVASQSVETATVVRKDDKIVFEQVQAGYPCKDKLFRDLRDKEA